MKKNFLRILAVLTSVIFVILSVPFTSAAASAQDCLFFIMPEDNEGLSFAVGSYEKTSVKSYIFLPKTVDASNVVVRYSEELTIVGGDAVTSWNSAEKTFTVDTTVSDHVYAGPKTLYFMQSSLPALSVKLNEGESLQTIHEDKDAKIGATVGISGADNSKYNLPETAIQIKTRGYTSFLAPKKPYQIKFDKKTDLFGMGKAKKWILLANFYDGTSIRTKTFFDLADEIGMDYVSKSVFVDLYIDGDYKGVYQLIEKIEVGSTRVDLTDEYGVILEMECNPRLEPADIYFISATTNKAFVYKDYVYDFEDTSTQEKVDRINEIRASVEARINAFEAAIYASEPDWDTISSMIDVDSFILYYFLNEYGEQVDCTFSSTYFYMDGPDDVIHCGPIWDFDRCCGFSYVTPQRTDFMKNIVENTDSYRVSWYKELFRHPEFVKRAGELYDERVKASFDTDKVNGMIDGYQAEILPSLLMDHVKWVVFHNNDYTADALVSTGTADQIEFTTDSVKDFLADKKSYLDTAYGADMPAILFTTYTTVGNKRKTYSGGCIGPQGSVGGLKVELVDNKFDGGIIYRMMSNDNTLTPVSPEGEINHANGGYQRAKGIYIMPQGNFANYFTVEYRIKYNDVWGNWITNGDYAGVPNSSYVQQVQVRLIKNKETEYSDIDLVADGLETVRERGIVGNVYSAGYQPAKLGYVFTGWYTDPGCTTPAGESFVLEDASYTLYAGFEEIPYIRGDVDWNGAVNVRDLILLKRYLSASENITEMPPRADVNQDGAITVKDLILLKAIMASSED